jgi:hypothetical protein
MSKTVSLYCAKNKVDTDNGKVRESELKTIIVSIVHIFAVVP